MKFHSSLLLCALLSSPAAPLCAAAEPARQYQDQDTGLAAWEWQGDGVKIQHIQRIPDQGRAFLMGRGFDRGDAEQFAAACVFEGGFYNLGTLPVVLDLAEWRFAGADGELQALKLTPAWQREWEARGSPESARIAFQWALFPNQQEFAPGDWGMGMLTYPAPAGARLDIHAVWHSGGTRHQAVLSGVRCGKDESIDPQGEL